MKYSVILTMNAIDELNQGIDWYNEQKAGLGNRFYTKVVSTIKALSKNPNLFEQKYKNYRGATVSVFPFVVYYFIEEPNTIVISAIFHTSRDLETL